MILRQESAQQRAKRDGERNHRKGDRRDSWPCRRRAELENERHREIEEITEAEAEQRRKAKQPHRLLDDGDGIGGDEENHHAKDETMPDTELADRESKRHPGERHEDCLHAIERADIVLAKIELDEIEVEHELENAKSNVRKEIKENEELNVAGKCLNSLRNGFHERHPNNWTLPDVRPIVRPKQYIPEL